MQDRRNSSALATVLPLSCTNPSICGPECQMQVSWAGTSNYIPHYLCDVNTCPCPWHLIWGYLCQVLASRPRINNHPIAFFEVWWRIHAQNVQLCVHVSCPLYCLTTSSPNKRVIITATSRHQITKSNVCSTTCSVLHQRKSLSFTLLVICEGNPPVTGGFPSQRASNAKVFLWHHVITYPSFHLMD